MRVPTLVASEMRSRLAQQALLLRSAATQSLARARSLGAGRASAASAFEGALASRLPAAARTPRAAAEPPPRASSIDLGSADPGPFWDAPLGAPADRPRDAAGPRSAPEPAASSRAEPTEARRDDDAEEAGRTPTGKERYVVQPGDTLWRLSLERFHTGVDALARANGIDDPRRLRVGQVLVVPRAHDPGPRRIVASWYGPGFDGRPMANGDPYDRHAATIAHKTLPLGTQVELTNPRTGVTVHAVVTDRGPYVEGRDVDLSYGLAERLDVVRPGVDELVLRVRG